MAQCVIYDRNTRRFQNVVPFNDVLLLPDAPNHRLQVRLDYPSPFANRHRLFTPPRGAHNPYPFSLPLHPPAPPIPPPPTPYTRDRSTPVDAEVFPGLGRLRIGNLQPSGGCVTKMGAMLKGNSTSVGGLLISKQSVVIQKSQEKGERFFPNNQDSTLKNYFDLR